MELKYRRQNKLLSAALLIYKGENGDKKGPFFFLFSFPYSGTYTKSRDVISHHKRVKKKIMGGIQKTVFFY